MAAFQSHLVLLAFRPIVEFPESVGHLTEIVSAPSLPDAVTFRGGPATVAGNCGNSPQCWQRVVMKLGLLADIHERVAPLETALRRFREQGVDQVVILGDLVEMTDSLEETCRLLDDAGAIGVWGNHDFGLCQPSLDRGMKELSETGKRVFGTLKPRLEIEGCFFSHVEPWLDPETLEGLWYFDGPPDEHFQFDRIFQAIPHRLMFTGHYHKWLIVRPDGIEPWKATSSIRLTTGRYFVVVGPLCEGHSAIFDTETSELTPFCDPIAG